MTEVRVSEVLNLSADYIEQYGWAGKGQGWHPQPGQPACAEGGMRVVCEVRGWDISHKQDAKAAVEAWLLDRRPDCINSRVNRVIAFAWNDHPSTTEAEVIATLRACALVEAAKEDAELLAECGGAA